MTDVGQGRHSTFFRARRIPTGRRRLLIILLQGVLLGFLCVFLWKRNDGLRSEGRGEVYRWFEKLNQYSFMGNQEK